MRVSNYRKLGTLSVINAGTKHAERLEANTAEEVRARGSIVRKAAGVLEDAYHVRRPALLAWVEAAGLKRERDESLDQVVSAMSYDLLAPAHANKDRKAPMYRALFPDGTLAFIDGPDREEIVHVHGMVAYLKAHPDHPMAPRAALLEEKVNALSQALDASTRAEVALRNAEAAERAARESMHRVLQKSVTFLRDHFEGDEAKVDALFPSSAEASVPEPKDPEG